MSTLDPFHRMEHTKPVPDTRWVFDKVFQRIQYIYHWESGYIIYGKASPTLNLRTYYGAWTNSGSPGW